MRKCNNILIVAENLINRVRAVVIYVTTNIFNKQRHEITAMEFKTQSKRQFKNDFSSVGAPVMNVASRNNYLMSTKKDNLIIVADDIWQVPAHLGLGIKITDTQGFIYASAQSYILLRTSVVHLLKEHGTTRSKISNVSISKRNRIKVDLKALSLETISNTISDARADTTKT